MTISFNQLEQLGRFGNQAFQLAATIGIARSRGEEPRFNDWSYRPYFNFPDEFFTGEVGTPAIDCVPHIDVRARSYLQDYNLFKDVLPEIISYFSPSDLANEELSKYEGFNSLPRPILGMHIRRGDNVPGQDPGTPNKHLWHPCPPFSYYTAALGKMHGKYKSLAIFSDDPEWAKTHFGLVANYIHEGTPRVKEHELGYMTNPILDWIDWFLLQSSNMHILANSTFGIMAAITANNEIPAIVPNPIFGPNLAYIDTTLLHPSNWIRLEY